MANHDNHAPHEIWDFADEGDRIFLSERLVILAIFTNQHKSINIEREIVLLVEGPTLDGVTIGWKTSDPEVIDTNEDWDGAKFRFMEQLTGTSQWLQEHFT